MLQQKLPDNSSSASADGPGSSCGKAFANLVCIQLVNVGNNFSILMLTANDPQVQDQVPGEILQRDTNIACIVVRSTPPCRFVMWSNTDQGRTKFEQTTEADFQVAVSALSASICGSTCFEVIGCSLSRGYTICVFRVSVSDVTLMGPSWVDVRQGALWQAHASYMPAAPNLRSNLQLRG
jgi:hypothetical protein